ncbi:MAG TPA: alpha/beta hydrolase [Gemmatimonadaceae bacterium]|nr:alpha/beta hydrolase [Gemmatimonadaceae bacterium]
MAVRLHALACASAGLIAASLAAPAQQPAPTADAAAATRMLGAWQGVLASGAFRARLGFVVSRDSAGALVGLMKSIDQGVDVPATVAVRGDTFSFAIAPEHIAYSGVLTGTSGDTVRGTFTQNGQSIPLTLGRSAAASMASARPQDPKPPFPYGTQDVTIPSDSGVSLAGTVVMPPGKGPFPAVVFVTGSGPQDRDEALMGHRPFLVIADYLARHGIASLRYDDRGFAKSTGNFGNSTSADFADDAEAALHFLQHVPGIARDRVGILGHSEGALIGPMVGARSHDVAFLVLMAGPGMPGDSLSLLQLRRLTGTSVPAAQLDLMVANNARLYTAVTGARDSVDAVARVMAAKQAMLASMSDDQRPAAEARLDKAIPILIAPWMRYFLRYDSRTALRKIHVPVLALDGSLDQQVPARENLSGIDAALKAAGNPDYKIIELPNLNHLFQTATTGAPSEYATIDETIAPQALDLIASWINQRFSR